MAFSYGWTNMNVRGTLLIIMAIQIGHIFGNSERIEKECGSIDIRNTVANFAKLENCTVIEGFLQILLIDNGKPKDYENLTFPKLREITGYLLLYRAFGLQSLGRLFPNLAVIRGELVVRDYSLIIFEMQQLMEIGLGSLTHILRGSVIIHKNPNLCYVDTVDWNRITELSVANNFFKGNQDPNQCPNICSDSCKKNTLCPHGSTSGDQNCRLCWSSQTCQKVCENCGHKNLTCTPDNVCCHKECLGGCSGLEATDCHVCRNVYVPSLKRCREKCPNNTYKFMERRCILEKECKEISKSILGNDKVIYWKPFEGQCRSECPAHYTEDKHNRHDCIPCRGGKCPKICSGIVVNSVSTAQRLHGCTYINGSLNIQVQGGSNIIEELEKNLQYIQEIRDYLKVHRSVPLVSLSFLKGLKVIHGESLDQTGYSFLVYNNQNLQELWAWKNAKNETRYLEIKNGKVFFHFNPRLCLSKIEELNKYAIQTSQKYDDRDISSVTNGDQAPCDVSLLNITIWTLGHNIVGLKWRNFHQDNEFGDKRSLLGYIMYYRDTTVRNLTIFEGRDACGTDLWKPLDVEATSSGDILALITQLMPNTLYAVYVRTFSISTAVKGAQSDILYFTTNPDTPSQPINIQAVSLQHNQVVVSWSPPKQPNGNVTHYRVHFTLEKDSPEFINPHYYCQESRVVPHIKSTMKDVANNSKDQNQTTQTVSTQSNQSPPGNCCTCEKDKPKLSKKAKEASLLIQFEDAIHNFVYVKNTQGVTDVKNRSVRSIGNSTFEQSYATTNAPQKHNSQSSPTIDSSTTIATSTTAVPSAPQISFLYLVDKGNHLKIENFTHYSKYSIEVYACLSEKLNDNRSSCSIKAISTVRTLPLDGADDILSNSIILKTENKTRGSVFIKWQKPVNPNGLIVSYQIEYRIDLENSKPTTECIPEPHYSNANGHLLTKLVAGEYFLRLRATSLAGPGSWTPVVKFVIPADISASSSQTIGIIVVIVILTVIVLFAVGGWIFIKKKFGPGVPNGIIYASVNPEYWSPGLVYKPDEWEVPRDKIRLLEELGQGSFGMVYKGEAKELVPGHPLVKCAVKTVNDTATKREQIEFLQEASVMKAFNCHHVVKLLGVVSKGQPTLVIMELMASGDLKSYLRSHRPDNNDMQPPTLRQIFQMAIEIADGMAYLAAKKYVHRDLAARNCMVADDLTVKIGDFGMTRDIYETDYYRKGGKGLLPVRWMPPESLKDGLFDNQSDVWSFGVVLWEMSTLASQPYQGLTNEQVLKYVMDGGIMESPENCPELLYNIMKMCWEKNNKARPTFIELIEILLPDTNPRFREHSFYYTQRAQLCPPEIEDSVAEDVITPATPLKSPILGFPDTRSVTSRDFSDDELDNYRYFPSVMVVPEENVNCPPIEGSMNGHTNGGRTSEFDGSVTVPVLAERGTNNVRGLSIHSNEGSKGMSLPSSEGSKVSSISNGSLANGHVYPHTVRTTTC